MITVGELIEKLKKINSKLEVRIVNQYDKDTGETYHNEINDVYISSESGREDVVVLESEKMWL